MKRAIAIAAVVLTILVGGQSQALAATFARPFEDNIATFTYDSGGDACSEAWALVPTIGWVMTAKGCFNKYGDIWRIQDGFADGSQTFIYWENWLKDGSTWRPYRHGECNNNLGAPSWGSCNKDYYESSSTNYYGDKGSRIRFQTCRRAPLDNVCTPGSIDAAPWIHNNA
ncbi:hypothetical protein [Micromonospora craterilacus]|nr:hypothetical protein [Micromonospora craterilacus]